MNIKYYWSKYCLLTLKACIPYSYIFLQKKALKKLWKMLILPKKLFVFSSYSSFCTFLLCYFPPVSHSWIYRNSLKINVCVEIYKNKFFNILRSKKGLILKFDDSIKYRMTKKFIEYFFYKKKLVPGLHLVLVNSPKYSQYKKLFCKWDILKEDYQQSSNPVLFYGHYKLNKSLLRMQNKFISFLSLVIHLLASFDALIQRCFRVIQKKRKRKFITHASHFMTVRLLNFQLPLNPFMTEADII